MKRSLFLPGIKDIEFDPYRKKKETKRKIITLIIFLPLLFLAEMIYFDRPLKEFWGCMISIIVYIPFLATPFIIGIWIKGHLWSKLMMSATIPFLCMIIVLFLWGVAGITDSGGIPGTKYISDEDQLIFIMLTTAKMIGIGILLTIFGHMVKKKFINIK